jgi:hypothetical protein
MDQTVKVQLNLLLPVNQRDRLRKMAAEQNLKNLKRVTSAAAIASEILCEHLDKLEAVNHNQQ